MIQELVALLCGSAECGSGFLQSPCFMLAGSIVVKALTVFVLGFSNATLPSASSCSPFVKTVRWMGCIESAAAILPVFFHFIHDVAYVSVIDTLLSILFYFMLSECFNRSTVDRIDFALVGLNLFCLLSLFGIYVHSK